MTKVDAEVIEDASEIQSFNVSLIPASIEANFDELEARVDELLSEYDGFDWNSSDASVIKEIKRERAYLNSIQKEIDTRRIAVKREYTKPLVDFEERVKAINSKIAGVTQSMKVGIDTYEDGLKAKKRERLAELYFEYAPVLTNVVPFSKLLEGEKWLNKSFIEQKAQDEMYNKVDRIASQWEQLKSLNIPNVADAERKFFECLDLGEAIQYANKLREDQAKLEAMKAEVAANTQPQEPEPPKVVEGPVPEELANIPNIKPEPKPAEEKCPWVIVIPSATLSDMKALAEILKPFELGGSIKRGTIESLAQRGY